MIILAKAAYFSVLARPLKGTAMIKLLPLALADGIEKANLALAEILF